MTCLQMLVGKLICPWISSLKILSESYSDPASGSIRLGGGMKHFWEGVMDSWRMSEVGPMGEALLKGDETKFLLVGEFGICFGGVFCGEDASSMMRSLVFSGDRGDSLSALLLMVWLCIFFFSKFKIAIGAKTIGG